MKIIRSVCVVWGILCASVTAAQCGQPAPRALFVSLVQNPPVLSSRREISALIDFAKQARVKILFVQIYRENKAWFPSKLADSRPYARCAKSVAGDPFALLIRQAHRAGIQVHAWLNLLSLATNADAVILKKYGTDILTRNVRQKKELKDYIIDGQYFLEPGDPQVNAELSGIVEEVVRAYPDLDGIQFDYIRYPDTNPHYGYTKNNVARFKNTTGLDSIDEDSKIWKDWRRSQVTELLEALVVKTRSLRATIQVSVTGCMPYPRAYHEAYQDWPLWLSQGLVDFVTIMDYSPDPDEFARWIRVVKNIVPDFSKVKIGVGAYKLVNFPEIFEREFRYCEQAGFSCAIFHYGSIVQSPKIRELLTAHKSRIPR